MLRRPTALLAVAVLAMLPAACAMDASTEPDGRSGQNASALTDYFQPHGAARNYVPYGSSYIDLYGSYFLSFDLVSRGLNGQSLNGKVLDGRYITSVSLSGIESGGRVMQPQRLAGTVFVNAKSQGKATGGDPLVGAIFKATLDDGDTIDVRIDDAAQSTDPKQRDVTRYVVSFEAADKWRSFCGNAADGTPIRAIPLAGRWDYRAGVPGGGGHIVDDGAFTFACEGKILAECVSMGYKPWVTGQLCSGSGNAKTCAPISIADYHEACTRMLRADYCGDGVTHTVDGVTISAYDALGIRVDTEHYPFEAEWTSAGARCAVRQRVPAPLPTCWSQLQQEPNCGDTSHFAEGTLIMSEVKGAQ